MSSDRPLSGRPTGQDTAPRTARHSREGAAGPTVTKPLSERNEIGVTRRGIAPAGRSRQRPGSPRRPAPRRRRPRPCSAVGRLHRPAVEDADPVGEVAARARRARARIAAQTSCASAAVAVRRCRSPRPARRRDDARRDLLAGRPARRAVELAVQCSTWPPASRTSSGSPMQMIGVMPCRKAALALAVTSASSPAWYCRRSECPTHDVTAAELGQHRPAHLAGVGAAVVHRQVLRAVPERQLVAVDEGLHAAQVGERRQHHDLRRVAVAVAAARRRSSAPGRSPRGG